MNRIQNTHLVPAVADLDAREALALRVAQRHDERVDAVVDERARALGARELQAREDGRGAPVLGRVADPPLDRAVVGRGHDPLVGREVEDRLGLERRDVGAVAELGHGKAAGEAEGVDVGEVGAPVALGAEVQDRSCVVCGWGGE
jgi:hypothetical protein